MVDGNGNMQDIELTHWYALHEKVMCEQCRNSLQQVVYCVHADSIAAEDHALAQANGHAHGQRMPLICLSELNSLAVLRNVIADRLWERFMEKPENRGFKGPLQEYHLSRMQASSAGV
eukprot:739480-Rhodomonas_salina.1